MKRKKNPHRKTRRSTGVATPPPPSVEQLQEEIETLRKSLESQAQRSMRLRDAVRHYESMADRDMRNRPTRIRTVVRTVIISGDPRWVEETLERSIPHGQMRHMPKGSVSAETVTDRTVLLNRTDDRRVASAEEAYSELALAGAPKEQP